MSTLLGADAESLLNHVCAGVPSNQLMLPGSDFLDRSLVMSDRSPAVLRSQIGRAHV